MEAIWGSANLYEGVLGSVTTKRLKNTAVQKRTLFLRFIITSSVLEKPKLADYFAL
jgi:hypothetical protein